MGDHYLKRAIFNLKVGETYFINIFKHLKPMAQILHRKQFLIFTSWWLTFEKKIKMRRKLRWESKESLSLKKPEVDFLKKKFLLLYRYVFQWKQRVSQGYYKLIKSIVYDLTPSS